MLNNQAVSVYGDKIDIVQYQGIAFHNFFFFRDFFDESGVRVIISSEGGGIHIGIENYDRHF